MGQAASLYRSELGEAPTLEDLSNVSGKLRFRQLLFGFGKAKIGEHIPAALLHGDFAAALSRHRS